MTRRRDKTFIASPTHGIAADADRIITASSLFDGPNKIDPQAWFWNDSKVAATQQPNEVAWFLKKHSII
jgi:hypothetical protein